MQKKLLLILLAVVLALSLGIVGCTVEAPPGEQEEEEEGPQYGGNLVISSPIPQDSLYPPTMYVIMEFIKIAPCVQSLLGYDTEGNFAPLLAKDWEFSEDGLTLTISLQEDIKFHDGTDFDAEACKWNLENFTAEGNDHYEQVESIDILGSHTLRLNFSEPNSLILTFLASTPGLMISPAAFEANGKEWCENNAVGTGPFEFASWEKDVSLKFERFDDYWEEGKPYLDSIEWAFVADNVVAFLGFQAGDLDVFTELEPKDTKQLEVSGQYVVSDTGAMPDLNFLIVDGANPDSAWSDIRVRQALSYAIDTETIHETLGYGYWTTTNQWAWPGLWAYNPDVDGYPYNPGKAMELLAEAAADDVFEPDENGGFETEILVMTGHTWLVDYGVSLQAALADIGITATINVVTQDHLFSFMVGGWNNGMMFMLGGLAPPDPLYLMYRVYASGLFPSMARADEFEDKLYEAFTAPNFETKAQLTRECQKLMIDEYCLMAPTHLLGGLAAKQTYVHDEGIIGSRTEHWTPQNAWLDK